ncbi:hypothetical protein ACJJTC_007807 [Scirpophaga incertulas]
MAPIKCCVSGCSATNLTHRLYSFPKDDNLQALWLSFLVPFNSDLFGLSKDQLFNKRVWQKHFDRSQLDGEGKRLKGDPCLFSAKEMEHGIVVRQMIIITGKWKEMNKLWKFHCC